MRIATGLLLALYLVFMWIMALSANVASYDGEIVNIIARTILFFQTLAFPFSFTMPRTAMVFLIFSSLAAMLSELALDAGHLFFAIISIIFALMCYGGHRELVKKKKLAAKAIRTN
ncbi:hypothetical protein [Paenibacillus sinopodophylli]|uniref:hypothetical protein n=1 Tax=Paenibacillus sinopodophylli TaxID=1837342 RepID=UPI00110CA147|nr:hypothetical protein [Paenibacillus sinopodophylli]